MEELKPLVKFNKRCDFIPIDEWVENEEDRIFKEVKGAFIVPNIATFYNTDNMNITIFSLTSKRCYNNDDVRIHLVKYLNYFEKFYDQDKELFMVYTKLKYIIDYEIQSYDIDTFLNDIKQYALSYSILQKVALLNEDNYMLNLTYINQKEPSLQYTNEHGKILMCISFLMLICIPLLTHYIYMKKITNIDDFLLRAFDYILTLFPVDIYNKLYDTCITNINKNKNSNPLWGKQDIRGINSTTHAIDTVNNIIINIIPKYIYSQNMIYFNYTSIRSTIGYKIVDISYEYNFISLSSSKAISSDEETSEFDKFESGISKQDESLYILNKVSCESTMDYLTRVYGPFDNEEISFYKKRLTSDGYVLINEFQKNLVFNLFYKYFGDVVSIKAINSDDYIKLIIIAKRLLEANNLIILPYVISGKFIKITQRKNINKRDLVKLELSPSYKYVVDKYRNDKINKIILSNIATISSSTIEIIDYENKDLDGKILQFLPDILAEEILIYVSLI